MSKIAPSKSALSPTVIKLGLVSFFSDVASEMLYPITPIFLATVIGASMTSIGFIEGFAEAIASFLKIYSGAWSDRIFRRKPFVVLGYLLGAISKPITGMSHSWGTVLFARGLDRTGKGIRTAPRDALLADSVDESVRGAAFGLHRGADTMGAAIGPLLALIYLAKFPNDLRSIYYWAVIPGIFSVLVAMSLKELKHKASISAPLPLRGSLSKFSKPFKKYILGWTFFALTNSSDVFLLMKAKSTGINLSTVVLLYCFYNLIS